MSKKINPTSLRIGTQLNWVQTIQNYTFTKSIQQKYFTSKLIPISVLNNQNIFIDKLTFEVFTSKQTFSLFLHTSSPQQICSFKNIVFTSPVLLNLKYYIYNYPKFFFSAALIGHYATFLVKNKTSLRKIVVFISNTLTNELGVKKIILTKYGPTCYQLNGFKILLSGRFEPSSTQMSKTFGQDAGRVPIVNISNYIEFVSVPILFKLGSCSLKIWLFYSTTV